MKRLLYILLIFSQLLNAQVLTNLSGDIILSGGNIMRDKKVVEFYSQQSGAIDQITFTFIIDAGKTLNVDWCNGVVSSLTGTGSNQNISSSYIYSNNTYSIRIYGDLDNVKKLSLSEPKLRILNLNEISKFVGLTELSLTSCILNSGSLADLPTGLTSLNWSSMSGLTVTGSLADLPTGLASLNWSSMSGLTVTGTIDEFPVSINSTLTVQSCVNTNIGYTGGTIPAWGGVTITFQNAWTSTELDDFLIGWATTAGSGTKTIDLRGDNAARTSASDAAVSTLTGLGKTILTN